MPLSASVLTPQLTAWKASLDNRLAQWCQGPDSLHSSMQSLIESGSRIRGLLLLAVAEGLGARASCALEPACAVEMAHLFARTHLALPCQRASPSGSTPSPFRWGESFALLAADALLTESFHLLTLQEHLCASTRLQLISRLSQAVGPQGVLAGQAAGLMLQDQECSAQALWEMHRLRSGSLLRCAFEMGALVSQAGHVIVKRLGQTGEEVGIALALLDDLAREESLLALGRGRNERKSSSIRTLGIALSRTQALQLIQHARQRLREELRHPEPALALLERMTQQACDPASSLESSSAGSTSRKDQV